MSTLTKVARTVKKLEVPRPLKTSSSAIQTRSSVLDLKISTVDDLIVLTQTVACEISLGNYDRYFQANVSLMYTHLKTHGAQLETMYKDLLDKFFILFRNGSQDENLDKKSRLHLLELIELRAKNWQENDNMSLYYKHRVTHAEPSLIATADLVTSPDVLAIPLGSPPPAINNNMHVIVPESPQTLLGPGEIIKTSGKFTKPTKIPGKNYSKDEVVIRNADSGKVSPGAKERLVQITGPNEENVNRAKHLIEDTIRRNASPVRLDGSNDHLRRSNSSLNSSDSEEASLQPFMPSASSNDALGEFKYTVTIGPNNYIKLIGNNLQALNEAKVLLDEHFENFVECETPAGEIGDFFRIGSKLSVGSIRDQNSGNNMFSNGLPSPTDDVFVKGSSEESNSEVSRRMRFSRSLSSSDKKSASPLSKIPPRVEIPADMARKVTFTPAQRLKRFSLIPHPPADVTTKIFQKIYPNTFNIRNNLYKQYYPNYSCHVSY